MIILGGLIFYVAMIWKSDPKLVLFGYLALIIIFAEERIASQRHVIP